MTSPIAVIGRGAWGTALATTLLAADHPVIGWDRNTDDAVLGGADVVVMAVPAQATRKVLERIAPSLWPDAVLVMAAKGLERGTLMRQSQIAGAVAPGHPVAVLSGPGFAGDLTRGLPTALTLAMTGGGEALQQRLATPGLRPYLTHDVTGTEMGGALKNVIAIACGVAMGAGLGESARAALMARGFAEMTRISVAAGARAETLAGLSGLGDLALTCTSDQSRNYRYGFALGAEGRAPESGTYEGAATADAAGALAGRLGVDAPVTAVTAALVAGLMAVPEAVEALYARPLRRE